MRYEIKKEYKEEVREYPHLEEKDTDRTYKVNVLLFNQTTAMDMAEDHAKKEGYGSVSLIRETEEMWIFEFYNKLPDINKPRGGQDA